MGRGTWSIALYLIAAFIRTVMSRSFNEARSMLPREIAAAPVIYGYGATLFQPFRRVAAAEHVLENYTRKLLSLKCNVSVISFRTFHFLFSRIKVFSAITCFSITFFLHLNLYKNTFFFNNHRYAIFFHSISIVFLLYQINFFPNRIFIDRHVKTQLIN